MSGPTSYLPAEIEKSEKLKAQFEREVKAAQKKGTEGGLALRIAKGTLKGVANLAIGLGREFSQPMLASPNVKGNSKKKGASVEVVQPAQFFSSKFMKSSNQKGKKSSKDDVEFAQFKF